MRLLWRRRATVGTVKPDYELIARLEIECGLVDVNPPGRGDHLQDPATVYFNSFMAAVTGPSRHHHIIIPQGGQWWDNYQETPFIESGTGF